MAQSGMLGINLGSAGSGHLATSTSMLSMNNPLSPHRSQGLSPRMPSVGMVKQSQSTYNFSNDYPSTDHFISQEEGESVVAQTVDMLINEAFVVLYDRQLQAKLIPFVASRAKQDLITLIRGISLCRDDGDKETATLDSWSPDYEPELVINDSHSRGVIPVVYRPKSADESREMNTSKQSRTKKSISSPMSMSRSREQSPDGKAQSRTSPSRPGALSKGPGLDGPALPQTEQPVVNSSRATTSTKPRNTDRIKDKLEQERKAAEALKAKIQEIEKEEQDRFNRVKHELKGKEYTYDTDGSIIVINHVAPDKLPSNKLKVKVNVIDDEPQTTANGSKSKTDKREVGMKKAKSKGDEGSGDPSALVHPSGGKKKSNLEEITFREAPAIPIANIDNMKLASGVIVREGSKVRSGQKKTGEPTRMSKKEYEVSHISESG
eukprot:TRINITY_DN2575_c0_g1_i7.p1 TRINITY_DN2575_c0_g1~~TRINITY_DN2575_c0_g1_i7.p1  ORF type:complete len:435 (+),score=84.98 TRINITY_DN2575_c0_g1_i7:227-1531(+)